MQNQPRLSRGRLLFWTVGPVLTALAAVALVYYWRVFYSYGQYPFAQIPASLLTVGLVGLGLGAWGIAFFLHQKVKSFSFTAATAVFCVGLLFVFGNPPLQAPDETQHFLRAYAIAAGRLNFDAGRGYPADVTALVDTFSMAWTNAHDGAALKGRVPAGVKTPTPQDVVQGEGIASQYLDYHALVAGDAQAMERYGDPTKSMLGEPLLFVILPLLPQALGIFVAKLLGFGALGTLYGARLVNLACYALLCYAALKQCRRYRPVFLAVMLLPLSLFLAGSCSYDGLMLGLYVFAGSYYCKDEVTSRDFVWFGIAVAIMTSVKINNLLWLALPLVLPQSAWKLRLKKWQVALLILSTALLASQALSWYGGWAQTGYGEIGRTIEGADTLGQALFVLQNPLRTVAVFFGTLFENDFFFSHLGTFGSMDLPIPMVGLLSCLGLLLGAALSVHHRSSLTPRSCFGLLGLCAAYTASVMAGLYITYTPVGMARVIGLQARYFMPVYLMLFILLAALLSHVLSPSDAGGGTHRALHLGLLVPVAVGICGGALLFQYYFVGPVALVSLAT